jgi:tRNA nucleotidyltransferase (CCA-adding enzyme)
VSARLARESVDPAAIPAPAREICEVLRDEGHGAWVVGGCVRDHLLGRAVADWDLCTSARPERVLRLFARTIPTGIAHGTVTVVRDREHYEVTTLRGDGDYTDGRRPDAVRFLDDIADDLARRDFTVNAIAYDPLARELVDPHGGLDDLRAGLLRAVGDPARRFGEDGLRVLRGARFTASLGFDLEPATEAAIPGALAVFGRVSAERVREEWIKALRAPAPSRAFAVMARTGILGVTVPALAAAAGADPAAWARTLGAVDAVRGPVTWRLAALLHALEPKALDAWLKATKFSNDERATVLALRRALPVAPTGAWTDAEVRRWLRGVGRELAPAVLDVAAAVQGEAALEGLRARVGAALAAGVPLSVGELAVDGNAVMAALGIPPSRELGVLLAALLERVLDEPGLNTPDALMALARAARSPDA